MAFDTVPHDTLISKLRKYALHVNTVRQVQKLLKNHFEIGYQSFAVRLDRHQKALPWALYINYFHC